MLSAGSASNMVASLIEFQTQIALVLLRGVVSSGHDFRR